MTQFVEVTCMNLYFRPRAVDASASRASRDKHDSAYEFSVTVANWGLDIQKYTESAQTSVISGTREPSSSARYIRG